jgi:hypothetical protein
MFLTNGDHNMRTIKHAGELLKITKPQHRILATLQFSGHVAKLGDFAEGRGRFRKNLIKGEDPDHLEKLGVHICYPWKLRHWDDFHQTPPPYHRRVRKFFADNPRCPYGVFSDKRKVNRLLWKLTGMELD